MPDETHTIGEMCAAFGVTPRTLRFYEAKELLAPIREGQKRLYTRRCRARLKLILQGKRFGISLEDIRQLLNLYDIGDQQATQIARTYQLGVERLHAMEAQRDELERCHRRPARTDEVGRGRSRRARRAAGRRIGDEEAWPPTPRRSATWPSCCTTCSKVEAQAIPGYADLDPDFTAAILEEAGKIARDVLAPLNAIGDREGCVLENGVVRTPSGFRDAFDLLRDGGWTGLDCDPDYGGQGMPYVLHAAVGEMHSAANMAFGMYSGLTHGAYSAIHAHGTRRAEGARGCRSWSPASGPAR